MQCGSYDVILASDVIYTPKLVPDLLKTVKALLGPQTLLVLGMERREGAEDVTSWLLLNDGCEEVCAGSCFVPLVVLAFVAIWLLLNGDCTEVRGTCLHRQIAVNACWTQEATGNSNNI